MKPDEFTITILFPGGHKILIHLFYWVIMLKRIILIPTRDPKAKGPILLSNVEYRSEAYEDAGLNPLKINPNDKGITVYRKQEETYTTTFLCFTFYFSIYKKTVWANKFYPGHNFKTRPRPIRQLHTEDVDGLSMPYHG